MVLYSKKLVFVLFSILLSLTANAQAINDRMALNEESKVDNIMHMSFEDVIPSANLYGDFWDNNKAHYKAESIPESYKIDLRGYAMPIKESIITSNFGKRWGRNHNGVDIKAYHGDTIYAAFSGKVRIVRNDPRGYGQYIVIRHHNGLETVYGHLSKQLVKVNQTVKEGTPIGLAGNTGRSTGTHLHFETRFCGIPIDPIELFSFRFNDVTDDFYVFRKKKK